MLRGTMVYRLTCNLEALNFKATPPSYNFEIILPCAWGPIFESLVSTGLPTDKFFLNETQGYTHFAAVFAHYFGIYNEVAVPYDARRLSASAHYIVNGTSAMSHL